MRELYEVALVSASYPPYTFGGIDVQTYDLAHALSSNGINVTVFCGRAKKPTTICERKRLRIFRLPIMDIPPRVVWFQLQNVNFFKKNLPEYDVVHTQHSSGAIYGFLKEKIKKPWIVSFHDHQFRRLCVLFDSKPWSLSLGDILYYTAGYPLFELLTRVEIRYADHYIVCGKSGFRDYMSFNKMDPFKTTLIPNGVNLEKIYVALKSFKEKSDLREKEEFVIFTCGRLYASKGMQYLIRAMPEVIKNFPGVHLKMFGKGPLRHSLEQLIYDLELKNHVTLEGHVPYEQLMYELYKCDLAVFPSLVEVGASLAVLEAMAFRKAVIAFKYPFTREIIKHLKTGYVVQHKNVTELSKAISFLLGDQKLREKLGSNAYLTVLKDHNWSTLVKKYIEVYSQVISMKK